MLWLDQTGLRSDAAVGATWAPVGQTPVVGKPGVRFGANAMAATSNKGELYFTVHHGSLTTDIMTKFFDRLTRHLDRKSTSSPTDIPPTAPGWCVTGSPSTPTESNCISCLATALNSTP